MSDRSINSPDFQKNVSCRVAFVQLYYYWNKKVQHAKCLTVLEKYPKHTIYVGHNTLKHFACTLTPTQYKCNKCVLAIIF